jgi:FKBP-type peptidyl-prolyl cis-trans isomerase SlyD
LDSIERNKVVSMTVELHDAQGALLHAAGDALVYLHGGHGGLPEALEQALEGKAEGELVRVHLEPEQAFGDYDPELMRVEPLSRYGAGIEVGMEVEDAFDGGAPQLYLVTDVAENKVVLDANHPLAGMALEFTCRVLVVRDASPGEIERGAPDRPQ